LGMLSTAPATTPIIFLLHSIAFYIYIIYP
jgi:hypothetical protein